MDSGSWLSCFDRSAAASEAYVKAVYGEPGVKTLDWSTLTVVFPWYLSRPDNSTSKETVDQCLLRSEQVYKKRLINALWVNYTSHRATGHVPTTAFINRGGFPNSTRKPCQQAVWGWVEIMHQPSVSVARWYQVSWTDQLWMYVVRGSGLWYYAGRTLLCKDTVDLAAFLNYSSYKRRVGDTKPPLFEEARRRLAGSFDTISFDSHIDGACCHRMVMHEIFSISSTTKGRCPVSSTMRRGWPPKLRACDCMGLRGTVPSGPRQCPLDRGWDAHWENGHAHYQPRNASLRSGLWGHSNSRKRPVTTSSAFSLCETWARWAGLRGTLMQDCANSTVRRACGGACCRHTPWPLGTLMPPQSTAWTEIKSIC